MSTKSTNKFIKLKSGRCALITEDGVVLHTYGSKKSQPKEKKPKTRRIHKRETPVHEPGHSPYGIYDDPLSYNLAKAIDSFHEDSQGCVNGDYIGDSTHEPDFIDLLTDERFMNDDD